MPPSAPNTDSPPTITIPHWTERPDFFVWDVFDRASADPTRRPGRDATQQETLLAETDSFYVIPDQFGVVDGHVLILPKAASSSIASLDAQLDAEIAWLLRHVSEAIAATYDAQVVVAEHGECGCATAGQAHVHVLPVPMIVTSAQLRAVIDQVLQRRMVGIERIVYRGAEFTALEDLHALIDVDGATVVGRQALTGDLVGPVTYPAAARRATALTQPYVYFAGPGVEFLSTHPFRSQFVREVVGRIAGLPRGTWDRWVNTSRENMFSTFARLSPAFGAAATSRFGFTPRSGI